jgi:hypothetical protein
VDGHLAASRVGHGVEVPLANQVLRADVGAVAELDPVGLVVAQRRRQLPFCSLVASLAEEDDVMLWEMGLGSAVEHIAQGRHSQSSP